MTEEQKIRVAGEQMAALIHLHMDKEELHAAAEVAVEATEALSRVMDRRFQGRMQMAGAR